eukprot:gene15259-17465_t
MGLISGEVDGKTEYVALTDILGAEDAMGDMDFKVAGTPEFVTALQLDTKLDGIPAEVLAAALNQAKDARTAILAVMNEEISVPEEMSVHAPRIITVRIPVDKIGEVTGPSKPRFQLPAGAVDAHCHVFGPGTEFPYAPERKYTPCDASKHQLYALRDHLGFARNVVVQATCHGADNRALVDALVNSGGMARGVATVKRSVTDQEIQAMHDAGVRGVRFNFVKRLVDFTPKDELMEIAGRIQKWGWHVVIYFEAVDLPELWDFFTALPTTVVVDHMGRPDVSLPVDGPQFALFQKFMREHSNVWSKVSCPERLSVTGPKALSGEQNAYQDVIPFAQRIVQEFPDRVLWGTDWPHPNLKDHMPDDGLLVDFIPHIAPTAELQKKLLVDNPMRLYWPEEG